MSAGPVLESPLAARKWAQDEEFSLLHRSHTALGCSVRSSLTISQHNQLHTPHLRPLIQSRDDKLPIMEPLRLRLERMNNSKVTYPRHPCIFCGGPTETFFHIAVICHARPESLEQLCALVVRLGSLLPPRERGLWLLTWREKGSELVVDFLCGAVPASMARQVGAVLHLVGMGLTILMPSKWVWLSFWLSDMVNNATGWDSWSMVARVTPGRYMRFGLNRGLLSCRALRLKSPVLSALLISSTVSLLPSLKRQVLNCCGIS